MSGYRYQWDHLDDLPEEYDGKKSNAQSAQSAQPNHGTTATTNQDVYRWDHLDDLPEKYDGQATGHGPSTGIRTADAQPTGSQGSAEPSGYAAPKPRLLAAINPVGSHQVPASDAGIFDPFQANPTVVNPDFVNRFNNSRDTDLGTARAFRTCDNCRLEHLKRCQFETGGQIYDSCQSCFRRGIRCVSSNTLLKKLRGAAEGSTQANLQ